MIQFKALGPLVVQRDVSTIPLNAQMLRRLLAALLINANRRVTTDDMITAMWGQHAPSAARKTLQVYVHRLRDALGDPERILQEVGGYRIAVTPDELDVIRFELLTAKARKLLQNGMTLKAADTYAEALRLWRGPAYADISEQPPIADEAHRLEEERLRVMSELIDTRLALGHHEDVVPELVSLVAQHPYREDLHGHLMLALYRSGRQAEALNVFHRTRNVLRDELGIEPGSALRRLQESILRSDPALELLPSEEKPIVIPRELPAGPTAFTGRAAQLDAMDRILPSTPDVSVPIALISGAGGVGKTALAVRWAHLAAEHFPDGQLFIDLRGYSTSAPVRPIEALTAFLRSLGIPPRRIPIESSEAAALFRTQLAGRRVLIVLDNARSIDDVRTLFPGAPGCMVVVTSRDRLAGLVAREGASRVPLDVLSGEEAYTLITELHRETKTAPSDVATLAQLCAYLPLAIRIAVAHMLDRTDLTITDLIGKLRASDRLGALAVPGDNTMAVRKAFELSYRSVPLDAQVLFRRLGLMPCHDFTGDTAGALADAVPEQAGRMLELLVDAHLLHRVRDGRYKVHDLLYDYAKERVDAEDSPDARASAAKRFYSHYLACLRAASLLLYPDTCQLPSAVDETAATFANQQEALSWLDDEHVNIVASIRHPDAAGDLSVAWRLADQLRGYFDLRRHMAQWLATGRAGLWAARRAANEQAQAAMFQTLAHAYGSVGQWDVARRNLERAIHLSRLSGWREGLATAVGNIGVVHGLLGKPALAAPMFVQALDLWRDLNNLPAGFKNLHNLATSHWQMGNLERALYFAREAIDAQASIGKAYFSALSSSGKILCMLGDYQDGVEALNRAISGLHAAGNRPFEAFARVYLAEAYVDLGSFDDAGLSLAAGIQIGRNINLLNTIAAGLTAMATAMLASGDDEAAEVVLDDAISIGSRARTHFELARAWATMARCQVHMGRYEAAAHSAERGATLCRDGHFQLVHADMLLVLAAVHHAKGEGARAVLLAREALEIFQRTGCRVGEAEAHGVVAALVGDREQAARHAEAAARIYRNTGARPPRGLIVSDSGA